MTANWNNNSGKKQTCKNDEYILISAKEPGILNIKYYYPMRWDEPATYSG